ncbi:hypothetical protein BGZ99_002234 [Dissophora globulifera]|uniref:F-box domain-containing protein n=1 Tax=Dissophora globulifera TaxID=979702 RepID=A0A9P6RS44_9FUNG|nr:hypothetical protein BGZ99_002234 [Dissophora globulifera]
MLFSFEDMETSSNSNPLRRVLAIAELWGNIMLYLHPRQIRRLRLVCKSFYMACLSHVHISLSLSTHTLSKLESDQQIPAELVTILRVEVSDHVPAALENLLTRCSRLSSLHIDGLGLDISFLEEALRLVPGRLRRLTIHSEGFVALEDIIGVFLSSSSASHIQALNLDVAATGLDESHSLCWPRFRSILSQCSSLSSLSLGSVKITDIPESLEEIDFLHSKTTAFPHITTLALRQCDITGPARIRLLSMFPNLQSLDLICQDTLFELANNEQHTAELQNVKVSCTNVRSQVDQAGLYRFLSHVPNLRALEISGVGVRGQDLIQMAEEWTRLQVRLKFLKIDISLRKSTEGCLEQVLRQGCCSQLQVLDTCCGPDLILRFWNPRTLRSELPFLNTLQGLHLRKEQATEDVAEGALDVLNSTLRQMPRLVDLTIGTKLSDVAVFHGLGRDAAAPPASVAPPIGVTWAHERPFLQTLTMGCSHGLISNGLVGGLSRQVAWRFRFLEEFRLT